MLPHNAPRVNNIESRRLVWEHVYETLPPHENSAGLWQVFGLDLVDFDEDNFVVGLIADYYSNVSLVTKMPIPTRFVIETPQQKISEKVTSDDGLQLELPNTMHLQA